MEAVAAHNPMDDDGERGRTFMVEVVQENTSSIDTETIKTLVDCYIRKQQLKINHLYPITEFTDPYLAKHVQSIRFSIDDESSIKDQDRLMLMNGVFNYKIFKLNQHGPNIEEISTGEEGAEVVPAASNWVLPSQDFQGLWESLVYDTGIKNDLLRFVETALFLADNQVDTNVIACNRVVLLHGPPGTGKTSLCKALAQKLSIRLSDRYRHGGQLIEINSHSLFSKWFSESGKLVQQMFAEIRDLIADSESFVCVLIDEVESLTAARTNSSGTEPGDAVRIVNALLTQLDSISHYPNLLVLTTSNITGAIDLAFVDRADIKQYVGPPSQAAIYKIYSSSISELVRKNVILMKNNVILPFHSIHIVENQQAPNCSSILWKIAGESVGMSGRTLRKIPLLALAMFCDITKSIDIHSFLKGLTSAVRKELHDRTEMSS